MVTVGSYAVNSAIVLLLLRLEDSFLGVIFHLWLLPSLCLLFLLDL